MEMGSAVKELEAYEKKKIVESLTDLPLFVKIDDDELKRIVRHMHVFSVEEGDTVFEEGEIGSCICFVVDGVLDVVKKSAVGNSVVIAALTKGSTIGEMAVVDEFPRSATVRARTEATLITFTREEFDEILRKYPHIGIKLLKGIARILSLHLRKTSEKLSDLMLPLYLY